MRVGIIGHGRFGKLWAGQMKKFGEVLIYDKKEDIKKKIDDVLNVDLLFLLVPISEIKSVCKKISKKLPVSAVVVDACSVKVNPVRDMLAELADGQSIIATHPLFGPDSVERLGLKGQKIVVSSIRATKKQLSMLENIFKKMELKIIHATPEEHDKQMARSQALVHFLGRGLAELNLCQQEISTPDYQSLLRINDLVNNDTLQLFFDLEIHNPYARDVRTELIESLKKIESKIQTYERKNS